MRRLLPWPPLALPFPALRLPLHQSPMPLSARPQRPWPLVRLQRAVLPRLPLPPRRTALLFLAYRLLVSRLLLLPSRFCLPRFLFRANAAFRSR